MLAVIVVVCLNTADWPWGEYRQKDSVIKYEIQGDQLVVVDTKKIGPNG